jgi:hypothetical protein
MRNPKISFPLGFFFPLTLALAGCHLIDQTDINGKPPVKVVAQHADPETRKALVTIDYVKANPDYAAALSSAVRVVETRRPGLFYDVVSVVGSLADSQTGRSRSADVMTTIEAQGVVPTRIELGQRVEPGRKIQQVRVYLR